MTLAELLTGCKQGGRDAGGSVITLQELKEIMKKHLNSESNLNCRVILHLKHLKSLQSMVKN